MQLTRLRNAGVLVEEEETSILCDPWLVQGEYYGAWSLYPEPSHEPEDFNDVDYIYVSHIHPDHCSAKTLARIDKDIPVLIHDFRWDWLTRKLEGLGFDVIKLRNGNQYDIEDDLSITIFAADNCDPELCGKMMECSWVDESEDDHEYGSTQIDSVSVIDNGESTIVHINDAPFQLAESVCHIVTDRYDVDLLLTPYAGASAYPHCFDNLSEKEKREEAERIKKKKLESQAVNYTRTLQPEFVLPFSGEYVLSGKLAPLNEFLAVAEPHEARNYLINHPELEHSDDRVVLLNEGESIDLDTGVCSSDYTPVDTEARRHALENGLRDIEFAYESNPVPELNELRELVPDAHERLQEKRRQIGLETDTALVVELMDDTYIQIDLQDTNPTFQYITGRDINELEEYVRFSAPPKLLGDLLRGPRHAHWNNASIGSHLRIERQPNRYERGIYYVMNFFHA